MKTIFLGIISLIGSLLISGVSTAHAGGEMVKIPKGWFKMGAVPERLNEKPEHDVYVDEFMIDKFEVSAREFAAFLNNRGNPDNKYFSSDEFSTILTDRGLPKYIPKKGFENHPANNVSWFGADEYCRWIGKRLPTEAEWEKAARGYDKRVYPWGNSMPDKERARYGQKWEEKGLEVMVQVEALPGGASYFGALNMAGNVLEWTQDWYRQNYLDYSDPSGQEYLAIAYELSGMDKPPTERALSNTDAPPKYGPKGPPVGGYKVLRGGAWSDMAEAGLRSASRNFIDPGGKNRHIGFRCAK